MMKYKALLIDVDGTLVRNHPDGIPTIRVQQSITKAKKKLAVGIATNRSYDLLAPIFQTVDFSAPCAINGATQIIDPQTKQILWQQKILPQDIDAIAIIAKKQRIPIYLQNDTTYFPYTK